MSGMRWIGSTLLIFLVYGCASPAGDSGPGAADLAARIDTLQARVDRLDQHQQREERIRQSEIIAYLTPNNQGYSVLKTEMGALTVNLESLEPAASGTKVTLRFGNVTNATLDQVKAVIEWGKADTGLASEPSGSQTVVFRDSFPRGQWINVDFVLEGVVPSQIAFIRVQDLQHSGISLLGLRSSATRSKE